jgi:HTH-type transcriptional regulator / antitoxin HigA
MKLNINPDWLLRMAEREGNGVVSVAGLVTRVEADAQTQPAIKPSEWSRLFPVSVMRRMQFSLPEGGSDSDALLNFFDVESPEEWGAKWDAYSVAYRQTQVFEAHKEAVAAWVREAEIVAIQVRLADFDEGKLRASLGELRRLTREKVGDALGRAQAICSQAGVALVLVPELPDTRISGCARWLSDTHAMVGLTIRYKSDDQLWFTFFHEVAHILLHRELRSFVVDNAADHMGDDVVDPDMAKYEEEADRFAADSLIPPVALAEFLRLHRKTLTNDEIHDFAESVGIGPGIVIGRLQHDGVLEHWQGNDLKQKLEWDFVTGS